MITPVLAFRPRTKDGDIPPFPIETYYDPIRELIEQKAKSVDCDPSYIALPIDASTAAALGGSVRLQIKKGFEMPANMYNAVVGEPGTGKSAGFDMTKEIANCLERRWRAEYGDRLKAYRAAKREPDDGQTINLARLIGDSYMNSAPEKPGSLYAGDTTWEYLVRSLAYGGLAAVANELSGLLRRFDAYRPNGQNADRSSLIEAWDGQTLKVGRVSKGELAVDYPMLSITGGIQPELLNELSDIANRADGFVLRFLYSYPPFHRPQVNTNEVEPELLADFADILDKLHQHAKTIWLCGGDGRPNSELHYMRFDDEAQELWQSWSMKQDTDDDEDELSQLEQQYLAKAPLHVGRIVQVIHAQCCPSLPTLERISADELQSAITRWNWHCACFAKVAPLLTRPAYNKESERFRERLMSFLTKDWKSRDDIRKHFGKRLPWNKLVGPLQELENEGVIESEKQQSPNGGPPALCFKKR